MDTSGSHDPLRKIFAWWRRLHVGLMMTQKGTSRNNSLVPFEALTLEGKPF